MLRTINTSILAFLQALGLCTLMVLFMPVSLHNRVLLTVVLVAPVWLALALWVTQKNQMKRVLWQQLFSLLLMAILIWLGLSYGE